VGRSRPAPDRRHNADDKYRRYNRHQPMALGKAVEQLWFSRRALAMSLDGSDRQAVPVNRNVTTYRGLKKRAVRDRRWGEREDALGARLGVND
jgi:hypothetical protein